MSKRNLDRYDIIRRLLRQEVNGSDAARLLGLSIRHVRRIKAGVRERGAKALVHALTGTSSNHRIPEKERERIVALVKSKYADFGPTFAAEKLREIHGIKRDPETIRSIMLSAALWKPRQGRTKSEHRSWRQRRDALGEMLQFDGSYHDWFEGRGGVKEACLLVAIDDATGKITQAAFEAHEGVVPVFTFWKQYLETHGKPRSIYLDKFSTYKMNGAIAKENPDLKTQFGRVLSALGIEAIFANSPQAKGRVERLFDTLQDRLVKELRLAGIDSIETANRFLEKTFIPAFNAKFSVVPASDADLHRNLTALERALLPITFSRQEPRTIQNDYTFSFKNLWYQMAKVQPITVCRKDVVTVEEWLDGSIHVRLRGKDLNYVILPDRAKAMRQPWIITTAPVPPTPSATQLSRVYDHAGTGRLTFSKSN
ncbi:MAG TPA: ISNCY family transposase [Candidatus Methylomirabilis sp.]|nr:ISNCY family transposase [Candidatus Methylomirabilis sp.]